MIPNLVMTMAPSVPVLQPLDRIAAVELHGQQGS